MSTFIPIYSKLAGRHGAPGVEELSRRAIYATQTIEEN